LGRLSFHCSVAKLHGRSSWLATSRSYLHDARRRTPLRSKAADCTHVPCQHRS
jgi:hypothetical protein